MAIITLHVANWTIKTFRKQAKLISKDRIDSHNVPHRVVFCEWNGETEDRVQYTTLRSLEEQQVQWVID